MLQHTYLYIYTPARPLLSYCVQAKMGIVPSFMTGGLSPRQILSVAMQGVYKNLKASQFDSFEEFHTSILSLYKTANSALPGRHFEPPSRRQVQRAFNEWSKTQEENRKRAIFMELLKNIKLGEIDNLTLIVGLAAPPFSMVAKRAGENVHPFKMIKSVPDALFVPSFTLFSIVSVKLIRKVLKGITEEEEEEEDEEGISAHTSRRGNTAAP